MVEASKKLVNIYVDCTEKGSNADLMKKFGVKGYPTALFIDGEGKVLAKLGSRDAAGVASQMNDIAAKHSKKTEKKDDGKGASDDKKGGGDAGGGGKKEGGS